VGYDFRVSDYLAQPLEPDPMIEFYKKRVDVALLISNLRLTPDERLRRMQVFANFLEKVRGTAARTALVAAVGAGCQAPPRLYERMNAAVAPPAGLQQTQFAHIGHVDTIDGRYEVAVQRLVCTGMLAPRGQRQMHLFSADGGLAASFSLQSAEPLWCEGGRIYLFGMGNVAGIPVDPRFEAEFEEDEMPTGNVLDFSYGIAAAVMRREKRYGSSGGVEDEVDVR
jgi:hypothetical protein